MDPGTNDGVAVHSWPAVFLLWYVKCEVYLGNILVPSPGKQAAQEDLLIDVSYVFTNLFLPFQHYS